LISFGTVTPFIEQRAPQDVEPLPEPAYQKMAS